MEEHSRSQVPAWGRDRNGLWTTLGNYIPRVDRRASTMQLNFHDTAVAYTKMKEAALYFQHVVPIPALVIEAAVLKAADSVRKGVGWQSDVTQKLEEELPGDAALWRDLLPPQLSGNPAFFKLLKKVSVWDGLNGAFYTLLEKYGPSEDFEEAKASVDEICKKALGVSLFHEKALDKTYDAFMLQFKLDDLPAIVPDEWSLLRTDLPVDSGSLDYRLSLLELNLIDTSKASWEQIKSLREDIDSQKRLQRLIRFCSMNFEGKPKSFVEDDLRTRIDEHDAVVRKYGFDRRMSKFDSLVSSRWTQGALTAALLATFYSGDWKALLVGVPQLVIECGGLYLTLTKQSFAFKEQIAQHPLGFIISANNELKTQR